MGKRLVVGALIVDDSERSSRILAARRSTAPVGRWEFPGGKAEPGETPQAAVAREILEELGVSVTVGQRLDPPAGGRWPISELLEMELWWCSVNEVVAPGDSHDEIRWLSIDELDSVNWLEADRDALTWIRAGLEMPLRP